MFIEPSPREALAGKGPTIQVQTTSPEYRALKPEADPELFHEAATEALKVAIQHGFASMVFDDVSELLTANGQGALEYEYIWTFSPQA